MSISVHATRDKRELLQKIIECDNEASVAIRAIKNRDNYVMDRI